MDLTIDYVDEDEISLDQFKVQAKELIKHERDTQNYIKKRLINNIMESNTLNVLSTRSTKTVTYKKDCDALGQYFKIKATYTINGKKIVRAKSSPIIIKFCIYSSWHSIYSLKMNLCIIFYSQCSHTI